MQQVIPFGVRITILFAALTIAGTSSGGSTLGSAVPIPTGGGNEQPSSVTLPAGASATSRLMSKSTAQRLATSPDRVATRSLADSKLFSRISPSVVIVVTDDGIGSGSLIGSANQVLTNWHVVAGAQNVGVVYKPVSEGASPSKADWRRAKIVKIDEVADLALLQVIDPQTNRTPIPVSTEASLAVGQDVNAIGHPTGEAWTYTKGIVSQVRRGYQWQTESGVEHRADVIQTQTPINPGNSGGPLLNEQGYLVGVNSFIAQGEGLNFAVAASDVTKFLSSPKSRLAQRVAVEQKSSACEGNVLGTERLTDEPAIATFGDLDCDGKSDILIVTPDDSSKAVQVRIDSDGNGKIDIIIVDNNRDGKWDESVADTDGDGKPDMHGIHGDGSMTPTRVERM